jgi:beta propeller repeat protein
LKVAFTDMTTGTPTAWRWSFGDNTHSTARNPVHIYNKTGKYAVSLTVWNDAGCNTSIKSYYIVVGSSPAQIASPTVNETQITSNISIKEFPAIYGDRIVWQDYRNGSPGNSSWDIYMYDLSTSNETRITTNESWQENPEIYGDRIVWEDGRSGKNDIYMYNISTLKEILITNDESDNTHPAIYGDKIVWEERREGRNHDICMYTISTREEIRITNGESNNIHPAIYGDRIVWERCSGGQHDICMYTISTRKVTQITKNGKAYSPAIYGNRILWEDHRLADKYDLSSSDIFKYDLCTHRETQISTSGRASNSAIFGDRIVWQDFRNGNDDIYVYDLSTSKEIRITTNNSEQEFPVIFGDRIVWQDYRNVPYKPYIYMGTISYPPVAAFSVLPISRKAPLAVTFTDISTGSPTAWNWSFGDETANSTQKNPLHTYSAAGNYTMSLTVTNAAGSNTTTKSAYIKVTEPTPIPVANFSSDITSGNAVLNVAFTDTSTGSQNAWNWSFGDGTINSTVRNPVHTFNKAGNFTVSLTVRNEAGSNSVTKPNYIVVNALKPLTAAFAASKVSGKAPLTVTFTDKSTGSPTFWSWNFGDKSTSSARNPVHKYSKAGKYTIALRVNNAAGSNSATKAGYIIVK